MDKIGFKMWGTFLPRPSHIHRFAVDFLQSLDQFCILGHRPVLGLGPEPSDSWQSEYPLGDVLSL